MIIKKDKILLLGIIILLSCGFWGNTQESNNIGICVEVDTFSTSFIRMELPCGYKKKIYNYEEGKFVDYYYSDGSIITLFKGTLQKTPLFASDQCCMVSRIDSLDGKIIIRGTMNGKVWREDSFEGIRVYYGKVPIDKKNLFDNVLDGLSVLKVKL